MRLYCSIDRSSSFENRDSHEMSYAHENPGMVNLEIILNLLLFHRGFQSKLPFARFADYSSDCEFRSSCLVSETQSASDQP